MAYLLDLLLKRQAERLWIHLIVPPAIILKDKSVVLDGPSITAEMSLQLFRSIATTRHIREIRDRGIVRFIYNFRGTKQILVRAYLMGTHASAIYCEPWPSTHWLQDQAPPTPLVKQNGGGHP